MIIGITGKSGSGKSTVSEYLGKNLKNSKIISVDSIHIKMLLENKDMLIEMFDESIILDGNINTQLFVQYPYKWNEVFIRTHDDLVRILTNEIEKAKKDYDYIIIDNFKLAEFQEIWNLCDYYILVEAVSDEKRYQEIALRYKKRGQNIVRTPEEELLYRDFFIPDYYSYSYDSKIVNEYDESFDKQIELIVEKIKKLND